MKGSPPPESPHAQATHELRYALTSAWRHSTPGRPFHVWRREKTDHECRPSGERYAVATDRTTACRLLGEAARVSYHFDGQNFQYVSVLYFLYRDAGQAARRRYEKEHVLFDVIAYPKPGEDTTYYSDQPGVFSLLRRGQPLDPRAVLVRRMDDDGHFDRKVKLPTRITHSRQQDDLLRIDDDDDGRPYQPKLKFF